MAKLSQVTSSLERSWTAIRTVYPDVRDAAMVVYLHPRCDRRGHYVGESWTTRDSGQLDEVHISSHILAEGAPSVFRTLLHECCHSMAVTRGVREVSRQGRYHNKQFALLASEVGLVCETHSTGVYTVGLTPGASAQFRNAISELAQAIEIWQALGARAQGTGRTNTSVKLVCGACARILRVSRECADGGPILCVPCDTYFTED